MSRSTPSLLALLGLAAIAGYQNRGKISEMINVGGAQPGSSAGGGGFLSELGNMFNSSSAGPTLSGGLGELMNQFRNAGQAQTTDSWVAPGSNLPVQGDQLESVLGDQTLGELEAKTGLSRAELLRRLSASLPDMVDQLTPDGRLPTASEAGRIAQT